MPGVARRINAERVVLFGWSRAILLQLAHPLIAAGVAEHSTFRGGPFTAAARLSHTVRAMLSLTFGDPAAREETLERIRGIHRRVRGYLVEAVGPFPAGTPYFADDPNLLLWVHATLLDSIPLVYEHLVAPLTMEERDQYCQDAADTAIALGARPAEVPRTWVDLGAYVDRMHGSGCLVVGPQAREVAAAVLAPRMARLIAPAAAANRLVTAGLLPRSLRREFGFEWNERRERRLRAVLRVIRGARQEVTADPLARGVRLDREGPHPIQPIAQQQGPRGQLRQQLEGRGQLGLATTTDRGGQWIVQPDFQHGGRRQLGEGRAPAPRLRFLHRRGDLRGLGQIALRPIERDEAPPARERLGLAARRPWAQGPPQQVRKNLARQARAPIRPRTVSQRFAEQLEEVVMQGAGTPRDAR